MLAGVETGTHMFPYLDSTPFEGTVEILLANFLSICMVHELQCHLQEKYCKNMASTTELSVAHFGDLANSEADVFYQDAGDFSRRLDAEVLCTQGHAVLGQPHIAPRSRPLSLHFLSLFFLERVLSKLIFLNRAPLTTNG